MLQWLLRAFQLNGEIVLAQFLLMVHQDCHRSSFTTPLFTIPRRFSSTLLTLFLLTTLLTTHAYGKGENNTTYIGTRRITRETTLVGFRTRVGVRASPP